MIRLVQKINNEILPRLGIRLERTSRYRARQQDCRTRAHERQRLESLRTSTLARMRILQLAQLLKPHDAIGQTKVRLGDAFDGGYVCLNDFVGISAAFSFGISDNSSWDRAVGDREILVHQFDHTVTGPPDRHDNFRFKKKKIVATGEESSERESIASLLARFPTQNAASLLLKIDIESDEWRVLYTTSDDDLGVFSQLICELHDFSRIIEDDWWISSSGGPRKTPPRIRSGALARKQFRTLGNNWKRPIPDVVEVTYANRKRYHFKETEESFPTPIDAPNDPTAPDMFFGRFEMWPQP